MSNPPDPVRAFYDQHGLNEQRVKTLFAYHHPESGMQTTVKKIKYDHVIEPQGLSVQGDITDKAGGVAGKFYRKLHTGNDGGLHAYHELFELAPHAQDKGFSNAWTDEMLRRYPQHGVKSVSLYANISVGSYAWLKHGFQPDKEDTNAIMRDWKQYAADQYREGKLSGQDFARARALREPHKVAEFETKQHHFGYSIDGQGDFEGPMGKAFLIDNWGREGWHGSLNLDPANPHYQRGVRYRSQKKQSLQPLAKAGANRWVKGRYHKHCTRGHVHYGEGYHEGLGNDSHLHGL